MHLPAHRDDCIGNEQPKTSSIHITTQQFFGGFGFACPVFDNECRRGLPQYPNDIKFPKFRDIKQHAFGFAIGVYIGN